MDTLALMLQTLIWLYASPLIFWGTWGCLAIALGIAWLSFEIHVAEDADHLGDRL